MRPLIALALMLLTTPALAQSVTDCDWKAQANALAEPWEEFSRTFANGKVRLALIDVGEPAVGGYHLLVLSPPYGELGDRQCRIVTFETYGFGYAAFDQLTADYDPARGLIFELPVEVVDEAVGGLVPKWLTLTLNQATGAIEAWLHSGA